VNASTSQARVTNPAKLDQMSQIGNQLNAGRSMCSPCLFQVNGLSRDVGEDRGQESRGSERTPFSRLGAMPLLRSTDNSKTHGLEEEAPVLYPPEPLARWRSEVTT